MIQLYQNIHAKPWTNCHKKKQTLDKKWSVQAYINHIYI